MCGPSFAGRSSCADGGGSTGGLLTFAELVVSPMKDTPDMTQESSNTSLVCSGKQLLLPIVSV